MGNYSRNTFDPTKHYTSVRLQQGVPLIDADWNEADDIRMFEVQTLIDSFMGDGVPARAPGFACVVADAPKNNFHIDCGPVIPGSLFAGGLVARIFAPVDYAAQSLFENQELADLWGVPVLPALTTPDADRRDLVYLHLWEREVDALEDESLPNPLIGVETAVRLRREWVARVAEGAEEPPVPPPGHFHVTLARLKRAAGIDSIETIEDSRAPIAVPINMFFEGLNVGINGRPDGDRFRVVTKTSVFRCGESGITISDPALNSNLLLRAREGACEIESASEPALPVVLQPQGDVGVGLAEPEAKPLAKLDIAVATEFRGATDVQKNLKIEGSLQISGPVALSAPWPEPEILNRERPALNVDAAESDGMVLAGVTADMGLILRGESPLESVRATVLLQSSGEQSIMFPVRRGDSWQVSLDYDPGDPGIESIEAKVTWLPDGFAGAAT